LRAHAKPDLIIYAPKAALRPMYGIFCTIRGLAVKAKILVYAEFELVDPCLLDYLAAGVTGLLSTNSTMSEHRRALDTVMRGDSFIDDVTKKELVAHTLKRPSLPGSI
jgi:DNA-binding NarL/FixJ family response regulator